MKTLLNWITTGILALLLGVYSSKIATACSIGYIIGGATLVKEPLWGPVFVVLGIIIFPMSIYLRYGVHAGKFGNPGKIVLWIEKQTTL